MPVPEPDLRDRILRAAIIAFADHGYGGASVREVVEAAGCTKPALYYHFGSKADLYVEAVRAVQAAVVCLSKSTILGEGPVHDRLTKFTSMLFGRAAADPTPLRFFLQAVSSEKGRPTADFEAFALELHAVFAEAFAAAQLSGELRRDVSVEDLVHTFLGIVHHRTLHQLHHGAGGKVDPTLAERLTDLFLRGAQP